MKPFLRAVWAGALVAFCMTCPTGPGLAQGNSTASPSAAPAAAPPVLSEADKAALKADPDCQPTDVSCAWSHCYPLDAKWRSYSACLADSCQVKERACVQDLIQDLYDPDREKSKGQR